VKWRRAVPGGKGRKEEGIKGWILSFGPPFFKYLKNRKELPPRFT